jgi:4,5:9,10-diseco-3-hydroxy-5,9,17-trioxoandrosta-1(10),2-diene-4-oate hydrolase
VQIEEHFVDVLGSRTRYLAAGAGPALLLLHAAGDNATDWRWVMPALARAHRVYAPDMPSCRNVSIDDHAPSSTVRFITALLEALGVERASVVGSSLGGLGALSLALAAPSRVAALALLSSAGLGRSVHPAIGLLTAPGYGDVAVAWGRTPLGALQRIWLRAPLLFAHPTRVPIEWYEEQYRLPQQPSFLPATLAALRAQVNLGGQRTVLLDELPLLAMPTLVVWGERDLIFPATQARDAVARLRNAELSVIPECGHLPHVEEPTWCAAVLRRFLEVQPGSHQQAAQGEG